MIDEGTSNRAGDLVVPLDGREASIRAVPVAGRLARRLSTGVRLFGVVSKPDAVEERASWMARVASDHLSDHEVESSVVVSDDVPASVVAAAGADDVLCMATAGKVRFHSGHFGSVAEGVARAIGRPVFMVGPQMDPTPRSHTRKIVVPVDGSKLSEIALATAGDLAQRLDVPVWVVSVVSPIEEASVASHAGESLVATESEHVSRLADALASATGLDVSFEMLHSEEPAMAIVDFVGDDGTAVMTTHGRSGLSRFFAGSVTAGVVARSHRAVVVLRPFESG